jgi:FK506-binding nuclear protein
VTGTHAVYLTGNYIMDDDEDDEDDEDEDDYDLSPDELEYALGGDMDEDESDELDDIDNPRVTEIDSDEEEAPKLVETKKGKNKRAAEEAESLDDLIAKDDSKLSKKQQKKLKNNKGEAVEAATKKDDKSDKKVQFAKNLEQGPTGSTAKAKQAGKGVKVVQGVTIDDRTIGNGRTVKNGDTVGVRYIGKLANGTQFDGKLQYKMFPSLFM